MNVHSTPLQCSIAAMRCFHKATETYYIRIGFKLAFTIWKQLTFQLLSLFGNSLPSKEHINRLMTLQTLSLMPQIRLTMQSEADMLLRSIRRSPSDYNMFKVDGPWKQTAFGNSGSLIESNGQHPWSMYFSSDLLLLTR
jgi:hypothetical protein